jgi:hypothetical protein
LKRIFYSSKYIENDARRRGVDDDDDGDSGDNSSDYVGVVCILLPVK